MYLLSITACSNTNTSETPSIETYGYPIVVCNLGKLPIFGIFEEIYSK